MMHSVVFTFDDYPKAYIGYTSNDDWNGWATPHFELAEALRVMADYNDDTDNPMYYDDESDTFYIAETECVSGAIWEGCNCQTDDGVKHLYGIGAYYWMWDRATSYYLAEVIEDFIYELDTYGYRDTGVDREEMVESIRTQLNDVSVFRQTYEIWHDESLTADEKFDKLSELLFV